MFATLYAVLAAATVLDVLALAVVVAGIACLGVYLGYRLAIRQL